MLHHPMNKIIHHSLDQELKNPISSLFSFIENWSFEISKGGSLTSLTVISSRSITGSLTPSEISNIYEN